MKPEDQEILESYLRRDGFEAVSAIRRNSRVHLVYFVRRDSPLAEEIVTRLLSVEEVRYGDPRVLLAERSLPFHPAAVQRADAGSGATLDSAGGGG